MSQLEKSPKEGPLLENLVGAGITGLAANPFSANKAMADGHREVDALR